MRSKLATLEVFCLTCELGTFTAAARELGISPQAASRAVARLEQEVGRTLFRRNTRHVEATDAGREYYQACRAALDTLSDAEARLAGEPGAPQGEVRISVPTTYGHHRFLPGLAAFRCAHPAITVDVHIDNRNVDFVREHFDLAIRMGTLADASFVARPLGQFSLGIFASPSYLEEHGIPGSLEELDAHACALFVMPRTGRVLPWSLKDETWTPRAVIRVRHDVLGLVGAARSGAAIIQTYDFLVEREVATGELVELMPELRGASRPFSLIYPREAARGAQVRALIDHVVSRASPDLQGSSG